MSRWEACAYLQEGACDRDALLLPAREFQATLADDGVVAIRHGQHLLVYRCLRASTQQSVHMLNSGSPGRRILRLRHVRKVKFLAAFGASYDASHPPCGFIHLFCRCLWPPVADVVEDSIIEQHHVLGQRVIITVQVRLCSPGFMVDEQLCHLMPCATCA